MKKMILHLVFASILPLLFFINVLIPANVFGCRTRGLIAFVIALSSAILGLFSAIKGRAVKVNSAEEIAGWLLGSLILALPAIYIVITAY